MSTKTTLRVGLAGLGQGEGRGGDLVEEPALGVHGPHELVHGLERFGRSGDHQVGSLGHDGQVVVGDQGGHLDDDIAFDVQSGHLQVHPHQHVGDATGW